jgi:hypothetical protein
MSDLAPRAVAALGFVCWMAPAWALSEDHRRAVAEDGSAQRDAARLGAAVDACALGMPI